MLGLALGLALAAALASPALAVNMDAAATPSRVLGTLSPTSSSIGTRMDRSFESPGSVQIDDAGRLLVSDEVATRFAIYSSVPTTDGAAFDVAVAAPSKTAAVSGCSPGLVGAATAVSSGGGRLAVADVTHDRVLLYDAVPSADGALADRALGQSDTFTCTWGTTGPATFQSPYDVWTDGTRLAVVDYNRVLLWNSWPTSSAQVPDVVLGQPDLASNTSNNGGLSAQSVYGPRAVWSDGTKLLVADTYNNRVLAWDTWPTVDQQAASWVLGQADFASAVSGCGSSAMATPVGVSSDGNRIAVALSSSTARRVLLWNSWPTSNGEAAAAVLGDTALGTCTTSDAPSAATLRDPVDVSTDGTRVAVADKGANRVLMWNAWPGTGAAADRVVGHAATTDAGPHDYGGSHLVVASNGGGNNTRGGIAVEPDGGLWISQAQLNQVAHFATAPATDGAAATFSIGQDDATHPWCNGAAGTASAATTCTPGQVWTDGTRLLLADWSNNRVLVWNALPTGVGDAPDLVLGQVDFTSTGFGTSQTQLRRPQGVTSDGTRVVVVDTDNHRALLWDTWPTANGEAADRVLGQVDFTSSDAHVGGVTATSLGNPSYAALWNGVLAVGDSRASRILLWDSWPTTNGEAATGVYGQPGLTGAASCDGVCSVGTFALVDNALVVSDSCSVRIVDPAPASRAQPGGGLEVGAGCTDDSSDPAAIEHVGSVAARDGSIWINDFGHRRLVRYDDTVAPVITNSPHVTSTGGVATARWHTSESGTSTVYWDVDTGLVPGDYASSASLATATGPGQSVDLGALAPGTWYYRVETTDWAGNAVVSAERTFTVGGPSITDNQAGDDTWRGTGTTTYDVDVSDPDGIDTIEVQAWSGAARSGTQHAAWTTVASGPGTTFATDWALPAAVWSALPEGESWISIRATDLLGDIGAVDDVFRVLKDTSAASPAWVLDADAAPDMDTTTSTTTLEASWAPAGGERDRSGVARYEYCFSSGRGCTGTVLVGWTDAGTATQVQHGALTLADGEEWFANVRMVDAAGNTGAAAFSDGVVVDTTPSTISLDTSGCTQLGATSIGAVAAGSIGITPADCAVAFSASADTAELRISQLDGAGVTMLSEPTGAVAPDFNGGQMRSLKMGDWDEEMGHGLAVGPDGSIFRTAKFTGYGWFADFKIAVAKVAPDGTLDPGFGDNGQAIVDAPGGGYWQRGSELRVQPDGKVVVCGYVQYGTLDKVVVARLDTDGSTDTTFGGGDGIVDLSPDGTTGAYARSCALQADGRILVVGTHAGATRLDTWVVRLDADGTIDTTYGGGDGMISIPTATTMNWDFYGLGAEIDSKGRLVVAGNSEIAAGDLQFTAVRLTTAGALDASFGGGDGIATVDFTALRDRAQDVVIEPDDSIVLFGTANGFDAYGIVRLTEGGVLDTTFGGGTGKVMRPFVAGTDWTEGNVIARQPDGKYLVGGLLDGDWSEGVVQRLHPDGSIDTSFADGGTWYSQQVGYDNVTGIEAGPDGTFAIAGTTGVWILEAGTVPDHTGTWANPGFGACLRGVTGTGTAVGPWSPTGTCGDTDADPWQPVPALANVPEATIAQTTAGGATATAQLRFGARVAPTTAPNAYYAPIVIEAVSPAV